MPIELKNDMIYNKDIIFIDSDNATWIDNEYMKFSVDIMQPIRNAVCIKIIRCSVLLTNSAQDITSTSMPKINQTNITDDDPIYIYLNHYDRISSLLVNIGDEVVYETYDKDVYRADGTIEYRAGDYKLDANGNKISQTINDVKNYNILNCFEMMNINVTDTYKYTHTQVVDTIPSLLYTKEYPQTSFNLNDMNMHILEPAEKNLKRFDIELRDKNNALIEKSDAGGMKSFKMMLCVYSLKQNF